MQVMRGQQEMFASRDPRCLIDDTDQVWIVTALRPHDLMPRLSVRCCPEWVSTILARVGTDSMARQAQARRENRNRDDERIEVQSWKQRLSTSHAS